MLGEKTQFRANEGRPQRFVWKQPSKLYFLSPGNFGFGSVKDQRKCRGTPRLLSGNSSTGTKQTIQNFLPKRILWLQVQACNLRQSNHRISYKWVQMRWSSNLKKSKSFALWVFLSIEKPLRTKSAMHLTQSISKDRFIGSEGLSSVFEGKLKTSNQAKIPLKSQNIPPAETFNRTTSITSKSY